MAEKLASLFHAIRCFAARCPTGRRSRNAALERAPLDASRDVLHAYSNFMVGRQFPRKHLVKYLRIPRQRPPSAARRAPRAAGAHTGLLKGLTRRAARAAGLRMAMLTGGAGCQAYANFIYQRITTSPVVPRRSQTAGSPATPPRQRAERASRADRPVPTPGGPFRDGTRNGSLFG